MLMDVAELQKGLTEIHPLDTAADGEAHSGCWGGRDHVDNFVHATHMPEEDLILWVNEHWRRYAYRHIVGLLNMTLAGQSGGMMPMGGGGAKRLKDAIAHVDSLYDQLLSPPTSIPLGSSSTDKVDGQPLPPPPPASAPVDAASGAAPGPEKSKEKLSRRIAKSLGIRSSSTSTTD
jgi:hypothetical protein